MGKQHAPLLAFNRGEVSKLAVARVDLERMRLSAEEQINWMPSVLGPMMLRPGMEHIGSTYTDAAGLLIDFVYSKSDTAMIELTDSLLRVWIGDDLITRASVSTAVTDPNLAGNAAWVTTDTTAGCTASVTGGVMTLTATAVGGLARVRQQLTIAGGDQNVEHGLRLTVTNGPVVIRAGSSQGAVDYISRTEIDTGTHSIAFTPTGASVYLQIESTDAWSKTLSQVTIDSAGTLTLPTPFTAAKLPTVRWEQSGDVIYLAQYGGQQYKIERRGARPNATGWSIVKYRSNNGPFFASPSVKANLTPSVYYGNGSLTSDQSYFTASHVGALFRLFTRGQNNQVVVGSGGAFSKPIRVSGIEGGDRKFGVVVTGTWVGKISLERSTVGPDSGFTFNDSLTANGIIDQSDASSLNNVIAWYRAGFRTAADYTSGSATLVFGQLAAGGGITTTGSQTNGSTHTAGGRWGICRVTGYTSPTQVSIEVLQPFSSLVATDTWQESAWSDYQGWPTSVAFQEGRLWWFSGGTLPIVGSQSNNYTGFAADDEYGESLGDSGAILQGFGEGPSDRVNWGLALSRILCGREQSISSIRSSSFDTPLTPTNFSVKDCSQQGAGRVPPVKIGTRGVFVTIGNKIFSLSFNAQAADYDDRDLTRLNPEVASSGILDADRAVVPDCNIVFPLGDGKALCLLFEPKDEVEGIWRIETDGIIESVRVLPDGDNDEDRIYFIVKRTINGSTKRFIEKVALRNECYGRPESLCADSYTLYTGGLTTVPVAHLEGETVVAWAWDDDDESGIDLGTFTVASGSITISTGYDNVCVGLGYSATFKSAKLAYAAQMGTALNQTKKIDTIGLILANTHSQGLEYGQDFDIMDNLPLIEDGAETATDTVWEEFDGPMMTLPGMWDTDARLCLRATAPKPCMVLAAVVDVTTHE